ncbi:hypothetical protein ACWOE5_08555 [Aerococcus sanguinicola]|uniref:Uncharacterized protein n=1 Tax=Aerococcus sanguinicola TaxID=119206 RepID=A0A109RDB7_9LACT|nr:MULTISPECIES: hypothetical protein [Aerococcus]AMB93549.1 hypothetical protein AWM72_01690 [Aerococcus sanguinicola]MDK7050767.1 hypothetical protein [Aerococcus sanguinicola]OFT97500.1 hypothetical protein HMPREF3090_00825 [Aerococcus sp. HMSC23C02]PKZ21722.1 hypothetical protein CYJ28_07415 [Aerococcus sanguinicola]
MNDQLRKRQLSAKYGFYAYFLIFAITIIVDGVAGKFQYVLDTSASHILVFVLQKFLAYNVIAILPAVIIALTFYFFILRDCED